MLTSMHISSIICKLLSLAMNSQRDHQKTRGSSTIPESSDDITTLLKQCSAQNPEALAAVFDRLYPELHKLASIRMRAERREHTLQPTALLNEFFLRIVRQSDFTWNNRAHFLAVASRAMRHLLIDHARRRDADKGPGTHHLLELTDIALPSDLGQVSVIEFVDLLERLENEEPRMAKVVEMRCFGGLTHKEIAEALGVDERTIKRDWDVAGAWLRGQMKRGGKNVRGRMGTG
jgi:RNA polymerase sigma-70 factor (ECF subfamily)